MDINEKIKEKEAQFQQATQQLEQLSRFQLTLQGYLEALYEQRDAVKEEETSNESE